MKQRLDLLVMERGWANTRERARALILAGDVTVNGQVITKAGTAVAHDVVLALRQPDHPWVSRGGIKLAHALHVFHLSVTGVSALDIGASTGGFTDVLLANGARSVVALDVGAGQLHWKIRTDPRVHVVEGVNARRLAADDLPPDRRRFGVITVDVSFISLTHILPVIPALLEPGGQVVVLVKPQFEAGRGSVGHGGVVRDPAVRAEVIERVTAAALQVGLSRTAIEASPITGAAGNQEYLMLLAHAS